jgi:hypothetical protein
MLGAAADVDSVALNAPIKPANNDPPTKTARAKPIVKKPALREAAPM